MKAVLTNFKQSPRKVRLVADMIRGKKVALAADALAFLPKKSAPEVGKLLASAVANARQQGQNPEDLFVKTITVNKAAVLRRLMPMARGRGAGIRRTFSTIVIELGANATPKAKGNTGSKKRAAKKVAKAETE